MWLAFLLRNKTLIFIGILVLSLGVQTLRLAWAENKLVSLEGKMNVLLSQVDEQNRKIQTWKKTADSKQAQIDKLLKENIEKEERYGVLLEEFNNAPIPEEADCGMAADEVRKLFNEIDNS